MPIFELIKANGFLVLAQQSTGELTSVLKDSLGLSDTQINQALSSAGGAGGSLFSWPNLAGSIIFGAIGFAVFIYGKKQKNFKALVVGVALMAYPYFIESSYLITAIGLVLSALPFIWRWW